MRHIRRPQGDILKQIPKTKRHLLVALESNVTALVEDFVRIADFLSRMTVELEIGFGFLQHQRQPARVGFEDRHFETWKLLEPTGHQNHTGPGHGLSDETVSRVPGLPA